MDTIIDTNASQSDVGQAGAIASAHQDSTTPAPAPTTSGGRPRLGFRFKRQGQAISFFRWDGELDRYIGSITFKQIEEYLARKKEEGRVMERP